MRLSGPSRSALALLTLFTVLASRANAIAPPYTPPATEVVELTGWLHVDDLTFEAARVELEVNGEVLVVPVSKTGRIDITLPVGVEALLRFENPAHLTKEVLVDTRFAGDGDFDRQVRHVRFAVILEQRRHMAGYTYAGPVGGIGFEKDGGCVNVEHTRKLIVGRRNQPMVF